MLSTGPIESSFRVLVVDDEAPIRRLIAEGLTELGFRTTMAADGWEALALLRGVTFDAVVVDLQMAPVGGWEVIEYLRDSGLELPTLLLSAHIDVEGTVSALRAGVIDVLQKPVRLVELSSRLKDGIAAHQRRSEESVRRIACRAFRQPAIRNDGYGWLLSLP